MKRIFLGLTIALLAPASSMAASASEQSCRACHVMDTTLVGPGFNQIAARYKGDADAIQKLKTSMLEGSAGKWGSIAMPPNKELTAAEADRFAHWIMSLNK